MPYEQRDLSGSLFKNDRNEKETHADYKGSCLIDGHEYWIDSWVKEGKKGKFMSLAFKRKDSQAVSKPTATPAAPPVNNDNKDSDVPF